MAPQSTSKAPLSFLELLKKYDGNIKLATSAELKRVRPNGLKAYFRARKEYAKSLEQTQNALAETSALSAEPNLTS